MQICNTNANLRQLDIDIDSPSYIGRVRLMLVRYLTKRGVIMIPKFKDICTNAEVIFSVLFFPKKNSHKALVLST